MHGYIWIRIHNIKKVTEIKQIKKIQQWKIEKLHYNLFLKIYLFLIINCIR